MVSRRQFRRLSQVTTGIAAVALTVTACGSGGSGAPQDPGAGQSTPTAEVPSVAKDPALAAMVPTDIAADGKIIVGQDQSYPPNEFVDEQNQAVGMDIDLGNAIAAKLGLTMEYQNSAFDGIIPGLTSGKYELAMSSFTINAERLQQVDMVSYFSAGTSMAVLKGNPDAVAIDDLCGKTVAVQKGTVQVEDLEKANAECKTAGKPEITVSQFQNQTDVTLALTAKRAQAMLADSPVVDYAVKQTEGQLETAGAPYDTAPYGIIVPKDKGDYAKAVQGALQALIDDGAYTKILEKWGVQAGGIPTAEINPEPAG
ncbi:ABC transporter substrate-binding protein [Actinokineospora fastidiosa]|uniref:ABC transporter substrate-binding protein n=1 Tax=Actinokineospora fastidiosa TaxID=1816 RepID=A0A918G5S3_9PSEU|nr:ABC transporter substrate-binding protein [Actinokineospora fastidiosa]